MKQQLMREVRLEGGTNIGDWSIRPSSSEVTGSCQKSKGLMIPSGMKVLHLKKRPPRMAADEF